MRDFASKWRAVPDWENDRIEKDGFSARRISGLHQTLISGKIPPALNPIGWGPIVGGSDYSVQISRDRVLQISNKPHSGSFGWQKAGYAATSADDLYAVFELSGENCCELFARAANFSWQAESKSASMLFSKITALVYRHEEKNRLRIHIESPYATYFYTWLEQTKLA